MAAHKVPVILQTEASECGLACVAMIARAHGHDIDLPSLRARHLISHTGASLKSLMQIADSLDLAPRPLRLDMEHLGELPLPAILHWDFNHFVVITKVTPRHVHIIDPGLGARKISREEMSDHFTGVALALSPKANFTAQTARIRPNLSMMWSEVTGLKRAIAQIFILSVILQIAMIAAPFFLQIVVDGVLPRGDAALLLSVAVGFGGLMVLRALSEAARSGAILVFGNHMSAQMVGNVFAHLLRLPTPYFEKRHVGDLISRMGSTHPIQQALTQSVVAVLIDGVMAIVMLVVMFIYAPILAVIVLASVALLALLTVLIYPALRRTQESLIYAQAIENSHVIESIRGATTLKLFGREAQRETAWRNLYADIMNSNIDYGRYGILQKFCETLLTGLQLIIVVYVGATLVMGETNGFSLGMLFAFLAYRAEFTRSIGQLITKGIEFSLLGLHLDRLSDIVFAKREDAANTKGLRPDIMGQITIEDVSFRYSDTDPWVLQNVSLTIAAGDMVTFTGASGGGKTTLLKLILGLYQPTSGRILIDGVDLSNIDIRHWRQSIGVVMQDDQLLSGSILQNITLFDPEPDMDALTAATTAARIHDEIQAIPMGYDSLIGSMGSTLSGGQRQRVLLARALYHRPKLLFLDEGTANLDMQTEAAIVDIIKAMPLTRVIIAHRPAFINASNQLVTVAPTATKVNNQAKKG